VWSRIRAKDPSLLDHIGEVMRVNGKGNAKHCADAATLVEILILVPNNANTRAYRRRCSMIISRYQWGDQSLKDEIDCNKAAADANGGLPQFRAVPEHEPGHQRAIVINKPFTNERSIEHDERSLALRERTLALELASTPEAILRHHAEQDRALAERTMAGHERLREHFVNNVKAEMDLFERYNALVNSDVILYKAAISNYNPVARLAIAGNTERVCDDVDTPAHTPVVSNARRNVKGQCRGVAAVLMESCGQSVKRASEMAGNGRFGAAIKAMYIKKYKKEPEIELRTYSNGKEGPACVYSPQDIETWIIGELQRLIDDKPDAGLPVKEQGKKRKRAIG
jgi:hypothetical protein